MIQNIQIMKNILIIKSMYNMKKLYLKRISFLILMFISTVLINADTFSQGVAINTSGTSPDGSAILDINTSEKGFLIPRLTTAERDAISAPASSLLIYNSTTKCFEFYENGNWQTLGCACVTAPGQPNAIAGNNNLCQGDASQTYTVNFVQGVTYNWSYSGTGLTINSGQGSYTINANFASNATGGTLTVTPVNACGTGTAQNLVLTVAATPVAGTASSNQTICYNTQPSNLSLSGYSGTVSKWQYASDLAFTAPIDIPGSSAATLTSALMGNLTATTYYRAVVTSGSCTDVYSNVVSLTVNNNVTAGAIGSDQTICNGATPATLTSTTAGTGTGTITYEWYSSADGYTAIIGTSATYAPSALTATTSYKRRTKAVSGATCYSDYTSTVTITVNAAVTAGAIGSNQTICNGETPASLTSTTAGTGTGTITYEWYSSADGYTAIIGTSATYAPGALTTTTSYKRRTKAVSGATCYSDYTSTVTITVNAAVTAGAIGSSQTICNGETPASLTSTTAGTGTGTITYEWYSSADGYTAIIGTSATYAPGALTATTSYKRRTKAVSVATCYSDYTSTVTVTVNATVTAGAIGTSQTICNGTAPAALTSTTAGTGTGTISYEWQTNASGSWVTIGGATAATYQPPSLTATTSYKRRTKAVSGATCYSDYTNTVTITPSLTIPAQPSTITGTTPVCRGVSGTAYSVTNVAGVTYAWTYTGTGFTVASGNGTNSITANFNTSATSGSVTCTPSNTCGTGTARTYAVTINTLSVAPTSITYSTTLGNRTYTANGGTLGTGGQYYWYTGSCGGTLTGTGNPLTLPRPSATVTVYCRIQGTCNTTTCASVSSTLAMLNSPNDDGIYYGDIPESEDADNMSPMYVNSENQMVFPQQNINTEFINSETNGTSVTFTLEDKNEKENIFNYKLTDALTNKRKDSIIIPLSYLNKAPLPVSSKTKPDIIAEAVLPINYRHIKK